MEWHGQLMRFHGGEVWQYVDIKHSRPTPRHRVSETLRKIRAYANHFSYSKGEGTFEEMMTKALSLDKGKAYGRE